MKPIAKKYDTIIIGGGHNGLIAANYLAMAGQHVLLLERNNYFGGATTSKQIFPDFEAFLSQYSYLVSLLPKTIIEELYINIELLSRTTASYTPYVSKEGEIKSLIISNIDQEITKNSILDLGYGLAEWFGYQQILEDQKIFASLVWDSFLEPLKPKSFFEQKFEKAGQINLWNAFVNEPIGKYIESKIQSDALRGVIMTDAKIGSYTYANDPSLLQNRTFIYHIIGNKTGEWQVPKGGMGNIAKHLLAKAQEKGVNLQSNVDIKSINLKKGKQVINFSLNKIDYEVEASHLLSNASIHEIEKLIEPNQKATSKIDEGSAFKINLLLKCLPILKDKSVTSETAFAGTFHINQLHSQMESTFSSSFSGEIPLVLAGEIYCHTLTDSSILSNDLQQQGYHTLTFFGLDLPYRLFIENNEKAKSIVVERFFEGINQYLETPLESCLAVDKSGKMCIEAKSAFDLEHDLKMPMGNIFHNELSWFFAENESEMGKMGVETNYENLFICGSSAKRGGAVSGIPARNAAFKILEKK
jgi:phytoene dehydrogenase-like protein